MRLLRGAASQTMRAPRVVRRLGFMNRRPTSTPLFVALLLGMLGFAHAASAQSDYRTGNRRLPGTVDPFDHSAWLEVGFFHDRETTALGKERLAFVPMRIGVDLPVADHVQLRVRGGLAGMIDSMSDTPLGAGDYRHRTFRPGNVEAGAYYAVGGSSDDSEFRWTLYGGGTVLLPTAQVNSDESFATAIRTATSYLGGWAVHGMQSAWLFAPERWGVVPGVTGRAVFGPIFVNASVDVAMTFSTDDADPLHFAQIRAEAGYGVDDTFRVGAGITDVIGFGPAVDSGDDWNQVSFRLFLRADFAAFTFGEELVINRGDPFGNAFDGTGYWGLLSTLGLSL